MSDTEENVPVDPMDDPTLSADPPAEPEAVEAAERMNDPDGPQPGVVDNPPDVSDDDPLPDLPQ
jgi:hypothetical protein